jgi:Na+-transporting NADH:ubiquinone oxidoreductase subunit C|tara:strand:+ start:62593 stop:63363 length:771 start_codon:yes stop_codon:yes gene_type:complete
MTKDSPFNILLTAFALCLVCSILVSTAAIGLKQQQIDNQVLDQKIKILKVSGLWQDDMPIEQMFESVETRLVDLSSGEYSELFAVEDYNQKKASKDLANSIELSREEDVAGIGRRAKLAKVYLVRRAGEIVRVVLPIHGYGLWSTLYGYVTLEQDMNTVYAITFYEHKETPGLGGEVDNQKWQASWRGKQVYDEQGQTRLALIKGRVDRNSTSQQYQIDGLSGATLTSNGVSNMFAFWMGQQGYKQYLENIRGDEA